MCIRDSHRAICLRMRRGTQEGAKAKQRKRKRVQNGWRPTDAAGFASAADENVRPLEEGIHRTVDQTLDAIHAAVVDAAESFTQQEDRDAGLPANELVKDLIKLRRNLDEESETINKRSKIRKEISYQLKRAYRNQRRKRRTEQITERLN
eukprot:8639921-Karenia_brevis.AAC.1